MSGQSPESPHPSAFKPIARAPVTVRPDYYPNFQPNNYSMSAMNPMMAPYMTLPAMWSPNDGYYRYSDVFEPRDPALNVHSDQCCLSGKQCPNPDHKLWADFGHDSRYESKERSSQTEEIFEKIYKEMTQLKTELKIKDKQLKTKEEELKKAKIDVLDVNQRLISRTIESHKDCLQVMADYLKRAFELFADNEELCREIKGFDKEINRQLEETESTRKRIMNEVLNQMDVIRRDPKKDYDLLALDYHLDPFPDILTFYEKVTKNMSSELREVDKMLSTDDNLDDMESWKNFEGDDHNGQQINRSTDLFAKDSNVGKTFGKDLFPIIELPYNKIASEAKQEVKPMNKQVANKMPKQEEVAEPVAKPKTKPEDIPGMYRINRLPNSLPDFKSPPKLAESSERKVSNDSNRSANMSLANDSNRSIHMSSVSLCESVVAQNTGPVITQQKQKIIDRLKEKYPGVSEDKLLDNINKTREMLVSFGGKGFTGLKIPQIVEQVCSYMNTEAAKAAIDPKRNICGICTKQIITVEEKVVLSCKHSFHMDCLTDWAKDHNLCPHCEAIIF